MCQPCEAGKSNMHRHAHSCNRCARGHASPIVGSADPHCPGCTPGRYADEYGLKECKACETGRFQDLPGAHNCTECFKGFYQELTAQVEVRTGIVINMAKYKYITCIYIYA